jgi:hypothetical protein
VAIRGGDAGGAHHERAGENRRVVVRLVVRRGGEIVDRRGDVGRVNEPGIVADVVGAWDDELWMAVEWVRLRKRRSRLHAIAFGCHD